MAKLLKILEDDEHYRKFSGKYVCVDDQGTVISSGDDPVKVRKEAERLGHSDPKLLYVLSPDTGWYFPAPAGA